MGNVSSSSPNVVVESTPSTSVGKGPTDGCPVDHKALALEQASKANVPHAAASSSSPTASCPVDHSKMSSGGKPKGTVYNVYAQPIDPTNNMPSAANQLPSPGQKKPLSTDRVKSSIPKGGTEESWLYPSPQMFWNALVRKNKADGVEEGEINMVIAIHNEMNERTWRMLLDWEKSLHASELTNGQPSLRKFMGKPYDPSPKATLKSWFGYGHPFDRHDWYVDRGDKLVRYIIDYYYSTDDTLNVANVANGAEPAKYTKAIYVDVRPAVDDFTSFVDRIRRFPERFFGIFSRPYFKGEGIDPSKRPNEAAALATLHSSNTLSDSTNPASAAAGAADAPQHPDFAKIDSKCSKLLANLKAAKTDEERRSAHLSLTYCMSNIICPNEAASFMTTLDKNASAGRAGASGGDEERAFESMSKCVVDTLAKMREYEPPSTLR